MVTLHLEWHQSMIEGSSTDPGSTIKLHKQMAYATRASIPVHHYFSVNPRVWFYDKFIMIS